MRVGQPGASSASCSLSRFALGASGATCSAPVGGVWVLLAKGYSESEDLWGGDRLECTPGKSQQEASPENLLPP